MRWIIIFVGVIILVAVSTFFIVQPRQNKIQPVLIPTSVIEQTPFPIYIPKDLPTNFTIDETSFSYVPNENVLLYQAKDKTGDTLVFSQQAKPENMDFSSFNSRQLFDYRNLQDVPFPSTLGKTLDKKTTLLSVVTDTTWIIVTTQSQLSNQQMRDVALNIQPYKQP